MENGPGLKMYLLLKMGDFPASYVSLPEGNFQRDILVLPQLSHFSTTTKTSSDPPRSFLVRWQWRRWPSTEKLRTNFWCRRNGVGVCDFNHPWKNPIIAYIWPNGIIFHQPTSFPEFLGISLTKPPFGGFWSCEVAII